MEEQAPTPAKDESPVKEFADEEAAKAAGYTLTVTPEAAALIGKMTIAERASATARFRHLEEIGVRVITEQDVNFVRSSRRQFRAYLSVKKRAVRKAARA